MAAQTPEQEKRCSRCGKDVSNRSRAKDAQGQYICAECMEKARSAPMPAVSPQQSSGKGAVAARSRDDGPDDVMAKLVDESLQEAKAGCPGCRAPMRANQVICVKCGYHREKGTSLHTTVQKPKETKGKGGFFGFGKKK